MTNNTPTPAADALEVYPFAYCCAEGGGRIETCDCVNKDHGYAYKHARHSLATPTPADVAESQGRLQAWLDAEDATHFGQHEKDIEAVLTRLRALAAEVERLRTPPADVAELCERLNADADESESNGRDYEAATLREAATRIAALMQPDEAMVERAKEAILAFDDGDSLPTDAWAEDLARAALTAALKEGASGLTPTSS